MSDALLPPAAEPLAAARERAIRLLTDRYADDSLSTAEFESRLDRLYTTATPVDVETLVADLHVARVPAVRPSARQEPPAPFAPSRAAQGAFTAAARRLVCVLGARTIGGRWAAPQRLDVRVVLSEVVLDLRDAELPDGCEIDVLAVLGNLKVLLPAHADVDSEIGAVLGNAADTAPGEAEPHVGPHRIRVRLTGTAVLSEIAVRRAVPGLGWGLAFKKAWRAARRGA